MGHEISQFDIPDRQLRASNARPRASMRSDIGEAKIIRTIFGRSRVRVIREQDKILRAWLLAALAVTALAVAAWQGWIAWRQTQSAAPPLPLSERIRVSAPVFRPEHLAPAPPSAGRRSESLIQTEINSLVSSPNSLPPRPSVLNPTKPAVAKPATAQPLVAGTPQKVPLAASSNLSKNQTGVQQPRRLPATIQPAATIVAAPPAAQPAASKAEAVVPLADPLTKQDASPSAPPDNNQPPGSGNAQPQANAQTQGNARGTAIIYVEPQADSQP